MTRAQPGMGGYSNSSEHTDDTNKIKQFKVETKHSLTQRREEMFVHLVPN